MEPGQRWWYRLYLRTIVKGTIRDDTLKNRTDGTNGSGQRSTRSSDQANGSNAHAESLH
jgi:hypothetical protein